jgi:hypothetical protein
MNKGVRLDFTFRKPLTTFFGKTFSFFPFPYKGNVFRGKVTPNSTDVKKGLVMPAG